MPGMGTEPTTSGRGDPPGDLGLPFLGETIAFLRDPVVFFDERFRRHGPVFRTRILGDTVVCFVGPDGMAFFNDPARVTREAASPSHIRQILHPDAIPFLDGAAHLRRRRLLLQAFRPEALAGYQPILERIIGRYLARWADGKERGGTDEVGAMAFAIANSLFAGADPDRDDPEMAATFQRMLAGLFAPPIKLPFTPYGKAIAARDELRARIGRTVDGYRPGGANHVLERLVAARLDDGAVLRPEEIKIELVHFYAAAFAALQAALSDTIIALAQHPEVAARARAEVRAARPSGPLAGSAEKLAYVDRVGREVRRAYAIAPSTFFGIIRDDCEHGGYRLRRGWKAVASTWSSMRDGKSFPDPDRFDPDRFGPPRDEGAKPNAWVPHGGGSMDGHRCAGEALATRAMNVFIALAVRDYSWTLPTQDLSPKMAGLAPLPRDGLRMVFRKG
jgi:cytochrome P450